MKAMTYNKLVRDKIPEVIKNKGQVPRIRVLTEEEYVGELLKKLVEEAEELRASGGSIEERADVAEVLDALDKTIGWSGEEVMHAQEAKRVARGAFTKRLFLEEVL